MAPKRGSDAKAKAKAPPARGAAKAAPPPKAETPPKRGAAKAKATPEEPPPVPKRGAAKAKASPEPAAPADDYESWPVAKLKDRLKELGITASGGKDALVARLRACADSAPSATAESVAASSKRTAPEASSEPANKRAAKAKAEEPTSNAPKRGGKQAPPTTEAPPAKKAAPAQAPSDAPPASQEALGANVKVVFEDGEFKAEYAKSSRSECKKCHEKIAQDSLRLAKMVKSEKFDGMVPTWFHKDCFLSLTRLPRSTQLIGGYSTLRPGDQEEIEKTIPQVAAGAESDGVDVEALKEQNKQVFEVQDALSALSDGALKEMLELNDYPIRKSGNYAGHVQLIADGIVFGACSRCEVCPEGKGHIVLSGEGYSCTGWINEYLKCTFRTQTPTRTVWQMTDSAKSLAKFKKMKLKTRDRLFASKLTEEAPETEGAPSKDPPLYGLLVVVGALGEGQTKEQFVEYIQQHGGSVVNSVTNGTTCVVSTQEAVDNESGDVTAATELGVPGVEEKFITDCVDKGERQDMTPYLLWGEARALKKAIAEVATKFIEKMGVAMDTDVGDLAEKAHVLVEGYSKKTVYSESLTRTDLVSGSNSFYHLYLLESDEPDSSGSRQYWVWRKWGRIGVNIGGTKVEEFSTRLEKAKQVFCKQYLDKTGNEFGVPKDNFVVKPNKFIRVDVEHKALSAKGGASSASKDAKGGDGEGSAGQPLGKLSKTQIEKGDKVLDRIEAALGEGESAARKAKLHGLSAEYYSLIPHNFGLKKPPSIATPDLLGSEKALLQFYMRMGFEDMGETKGDLTPIGGVMDLPLPKTLEEAAKAVCQAKDYKSCTTKGATLAKKKAGGPVKPMDAQLYGAILLYTANAIYKDLNQCLRDENRAKVEKYFPFLRLLFEACARLPRKKKTLWRGVGVDLFPSYKVGSTIIWWGVSSCTSEEKVARDFMAGCGDGATFLTVETETACDISEVSFYSNEAESILLPGTKLEVVSAKKEGKKSSIHLKEVGRVVS